MLLCAIWTKISNLWQQFWVPDLLHKIRWQLVKWEKKTKFSIFFNSERKIMLRGCSSNRKMFHKECESHLSGARNEQFCYCGYDLCNKAGSDMLGAFSEHIYLLISIVVLINQYCASLWHSVWRLWNICLKTRSYFN